MAFISLHVYVKACLCGYLCSKGLQLENALLASCSGSSTLFAFPAVQGKQCDLLFPRATGRLLGEYTALCPFAVVIILSYFSVGIYA